jgi:hypothetical protein
MLRAAQRFACALALAALVILPMARADDEEEPAGTGTVDVKFADGSSIKVVIKAENYPLTTPYGKLMIPAKDVRLIELGPRVADDVAKQIEEATRSATKCPRARESRGSGTSYTPATPALPASSK